MRYGLSGELLTEMNAIFRQCSKVRRVVLFGSRAMGTYRTGSDIDLVIEGDTVRLTDILQLYADLENLNAVYTFDLLNGQRVTDEALLDHIQRVGVPIYERVDVVAAKLTG